MEMRGGLRGLLCGPLHFFGLLGSEAAAAVSSWKARVFGQRSFGCGVAGGPKAFLFPDALLSASQVGKARHDRLLIRELV